MKRPAKTPKAEVGDLVDVGGVWNLRGVVLADATAWWVISGHLDVARCIVARKDVKRIVQKRAVDPEMMPYLLARGVPLDAPAPPALNAPGAPIPPEAPSGAGREGIGRQRAVPTRKEGT